MNNTSAINPNTKPAIQQLGLQRLCRGELSEPGHNHSMPPSISSSSR